MPTPRRHAALGAARLGAGFEEPPGDGTEIAVEGAHGARRIDGLVDLGEGVSADGIDRVATVVAAGRRALVLLSIRTRPADEAAAEVERDDPLAPGARRLTRQSPEARTSRATGAADAPPCPAPTSITATASSGS